MKSGDTAISAEIDAERLKGQHAEHDENHEESHLETCDEVREVSFFTSRFFSSQREMLLFVELSTMHCGESGLNISQTALTIIHDGTHEDTAVKKKAAYLHNIGRSLQMIWWSCCSMLELPKHTDFQLYPYRTGQDKAARFALCNGRDL